VSLTQGGFEKMILKNLPDIGLQTENGATLETAFAELNNYRIAGALFVVADKAVTVKVKAKAGADGTVAEVAFRYKAASSNEWKAAPATGITLANAGQYLAVVTADSLSGASYDRAAFALSVADSGEVGTVALFKTEPRYTDNE
jgi:hypothetical protein